MAQSLSGIAALGGRLIVARLISICGILAAAAVYHPASFATAGVYLAFLNIGWLVLFLRYENAILGATDEQEAQAARRLCHVIGLAVGAGLAGAVAVAAFLGALPNALAGLFCLSLAARGVLRLSIVEATRQGNLSVLGRATLMQAFVQPTVMFVLMAFTLEGAVVLAVADALGHTTAAAFAYYKQRGTTKIPSVGADLNDMVRVARRWSNLPLYNLPGALASTGFMALPLLVTPMITDAATAGCVALALRVLDVPTQLIGASVSPFLVSQLGGVRKERAIFLLGYAILGLLGLVLAAYGGLSLTLSLLADDLVNTHWQGVLAVWPALAVFHAGLAVSTPLFELGSLWQEQRLFIIVNGIALACGSLALLIPASALVALAIVSLARAGFIGWAVRRLVRA